MAYERSLRFRQGQTGQGCSAGTGAGKTRITIRLDQDIVDRFFEMAERSGGSTGYQTLINAALREYLEGRHRGLRTRSGASFARNSSRRRDGGGASVALAGALYMDLEAL
ncbi:MAG: BrnA antitoxin family protein [Bryobacteraceae bacterium]